VAGNPLVPVISVKEPWQMNCSCATEWTQASVATDRNRFEIKVIGGVQISNKHIIKETGVRV
jgi:hypothetical protein